MPANQSSLFPIDDDVFPCVQSKKTAQCADPPPQLPPSSSPPHPLLAHLKCLSCPSVMSLTSRGFGFIFIPSVVTSLGLCVSCFSLYS